ncbi:MAG TPA: hypothetical protein VNH18_28130 [Bryobacteraceae bacterium]|nr:hypothetical protein [Bryobacteraceae bacterium]
MAEDTKPAASPPADKAAADAKATIDDAMAAFSLVEKALQKAADVVADLQHEEASGLRGLFATCLATLRAGKPGGA